MNKMGNVGKVVTIAIVAVILIIVAILYGNSGNGAPGSVADNTPAGSATVTAASPAKTEGTNTAGSNSGPTSGGSVVGTGTHPSANTTKPPAAPVIHVITPVKGDIWRITTENAITWDKPGNISGSISLIDAVTGQFMGVILPQIGPGQTSYTWNTRDLLLDRTNPLKKDVTPGTYEIRITYDGNDIQPIVSPSFTITN